MIDVVFLLLIFFLLGSNFRSPEGFLPAQLPSAAAAGPISEIEPLVIFLESQPDGSCQVTLAQRCLTLPADAGDFGMVGDTVAAELAAQRRTPEDPIRLVPTAGTRWEHLVKTYDALNSLGLQHIIFTVVE
jgi:biopolymer transport protein ExbD